MFSDIAKERFKRFRAIKRAWFAFIILSGAFVLSLFSGEIASDHPLILSYKGHYYFPTLKFYPDATFGGEYRTEADYVAMRAPDSAFHKAGGWMLLPPIPNSPQHSYLDIAGNPPFPPSRDHWLGTDGSGRDILSRLIYGFRISMVFSLALTAVGTIVGIVVGAIQGYAGGKVDITSQRLIEVWSSLPSLYVVILLGAIYGQGFAMLLVVLSLFQWIGLSYYMRGEFFKLREQPYVLASRALGASHFRILFRQMLPNAMTPVITMLPFSVVAGISSLTALDFLGFGLPPPTPSWGELIDEGLQNLQAPWLAGSAIAALFITLMLATMIGEGIRDVLDPKSLTKLR
ncbi:MAG TPA: ABC transporter permease [Chthoniobacteraceae bacterium]|nr:ABC transporter permease [Chthoniobacteraceae bacterium]